MRRLFHFRLDAHMLPNEMGRRLRMARVARVCPLCPGMHVGDERHYVFECPAFHDIRLGFQHLFDDSPWGHASFHVAPMSEGRCFLLVAAP